MYIDKGVFETLTRVVFSANWSFFKRSKLTHI